MNDVIQQWLLDRRSANIDSIELMPTESPLLPDAPLVVSKGQADAYYLKDSSGQSWILKKFKPGKSPDTQYIKAIQSLIPQDRGLESGYERRVLSAASIKPTGYYTPEMANWLDDTILMRKVSGQDWASLADEIREGGSLQKEERLSLCRRLSEIILLLEQNDLSHRDLSSGNVFVDAPNQEVHLIDWDSLYHSSLTMPPNTTYGTEGYVAPFIKVNGAELAQVSWTPHSDRFSLAVLNAEFLTMEAGSPVTGDGGAFDQDEIYNRGGSNMAAILDRVKQICPKAANLVLKALNAANFDECPSPEKWIAATGGKLIKVPINEAQGRASFVKLDRSAFIKFNRESLVRPPMM